MFSLWNETITPKSKGPSSGRLVVLEQYSNEKNSGSRVRTLLIISLCPNCFHFLDINFTFLFEFMQQKMTGYFITIYNSVYLYSNIFNTYFRLGTEQ